MDGRTHDVLKTTELAVLQIVSGKLGKSAFDTHFSIHLMLKFGSAPDLPGDRRYKLSSNRIAGSLSGASSYHCFGDFSRQFIQ